MTDDEPDILDRVPKSIIRKSVEWCTAEEYCDNCERKTLKHYAPGHQLGDALCTVCEERTSSYGKFDND